ncbi:hypothetical protein PUN28_015780 [Cardiocondyla obscurior]|uniref:Nucleoprotein n=1 Tax=Cardiocondyla obscurior TaxID=286306 RepID=A0AAW2F0N9_9HYME
MTELNLTDAEAQSYFETLKTETLEASLAQLRIFNDIAKYEKFNPKDMFMLLLAKHTTMAQTIAANPNSLVERRLVAILDGQEREMIFTNNMRFHSDMQYICLMFLTRGAAYEKSLKKSSEAMVFCMQIMKTKYGINTAKRKGGQSLDEKVITIPRIAATFPNITVDLFHKGFGRSIYSIELAFPNRKLPRAFFSPMMIALLPKLQGAPFAAMVLLSVMTDDILNQMGTKTNIEQIYSFALASYNSTVQTERIKIKLCAMWGIVERPGNCRNRKM